MVVMPDKSKLLARAVAARAHVPAPTPAPDALAAENSPPPAVVDSATESEKSGAENSVGKEFTAMVGCFGTIVMLKNLKALHLCSH